MTLQLCSIVKFTPYFIYKYKHNTFVGIHYLLYQCVFDSLNKYINNIIALLPGGSMTKCLYFTVKYRSIYPFSLEYGQVNICNMFTFKERMMKDTR